MTTDINVNAQTFSTTTPLEMGSDKSVGLYVDARTGQHNKHVVTLQTSGDGGEHWHDEPYIVVGEGKVNDITTLIGTHVRAKVTQTEGTDAVSTIDITIIVK